jgi:hypothetical protein
MNAFRGLRAVNVSGVECTICCTCELQRVSRASYVVCPTDCNRLNAAPARVVNLLLRNYRWQLSPQALQKVPARTPSFC